MVAAIAKRHGRSPMQVVLRWTVQHGVAVIPRSAVEEHIRENAELDFELTSDDMATLDVLHEDYPYYWDARANNQTLAESGAAMPPRGDPSATGPTGGSTKKQRCT